jgi:PAS domain S-box-containing protein
MGGSRVRSAAGRPADRSAQIGRAIPAELVEHAVSRLLRDDDEAGALPVVLAQLGAATGARAVLALRHEPGRPLIIAAAHPATAASDPALASELGRLAAAHRVTAETGGSVSEPLTGAGPARPAGISRTAEDGPAGVLMAFAPASGQQSQCALALIGASVPGDPGTHSAVRTIAAVLAARTRQADFSELQLAHDALAAGEARFRVLAELAPVGIVQMNADGLCTFANDRWRELTGMTPADAIGIGWAAALHPDDAVRVEREWALAAARGTELRTDCRFVSASGREIWVHAVVAPLLGPGGASAGFLGALTDVSARKRAEAERERLLAAEQAARRELADQTERLNSLITNAIPGIVMLDENLKIARLNQSTRDLFGLNGAADHLVGASVERLAEEIKTAFADPAELLRRTAEIGDRRRATEGEQFACRDGRTIEIDYWPVFVEGEFRGDLWLFWDVSERIAMQDQRDRMLKAELAARDAAEQAQQRLAEQNATLQKLDEAKTQYLATMSHELRTPLTSISSFVELIMDGEQELTEQSHDSLRVIRQNAQRLLRLVGDLLLLSSAESGVLPLDADSVSIAALIDETVRAGPASAAERGIGIEVSVQEGPPVHADQFRLQQVLDNLLSNAVKFSPDGSQVNLTATHDEQWWRIEVTDRGIGIPAAELGQLFNRFVRASNASSKGLPGTGLGLSIVKAITELHGGRVEVRSVVDRGTTFSVYLPIRP